MGEEEAEGVWVGLGGLRGDASGAVLSPDIDCYTNFLTRPFP